MEVQLSYFKSYKMMLLKFCTQYVSKFGKLSSNFRTEKGQFSLQTQRKTMPKNVQTIIQLHSFHMLKKVMFKILQGKLYQYINQELLDVQVGFRKSKGTGDQIANIRWIIEKAREFQTSIYFCFTDCTKAFYCVDHNKLWKILKQMGIPDHLTCLPRNLYVDQEATELDMEQLTVGTDLLYSFQSWEKSIIRLYITLLI